MYVCPCIIYEIDERYPLDATIYLLRIINFSLMYVCPYIVYEIDERYPLDATIYLLL